MCGLEREVSGGEATRNVTVCSPASRPLERRSTQWGWMATNSIPAYLTFPSFVSYPSSTPGRPCMLSPLFLVERALCLWGNLETAAVFEARMGQKRSVQRDARWKEGSAVVW